MYRRKLIRAATLAMCLVSLDALAVQDFSALSSAELMQMKPGEMNEADHNAFRTEMQKRSVNMSATEKETFRNQMREQGRGNGGGQGMQKRGGGMGRGQ